VVREKIGRGRGGREGRKAEKERRQRRKGGREIKTEMAGSVTARCFEAIRLGRLE
jgi:hypothetical protein